MARLYIGTSGFSYGEWQGLFYPEGLPASEYLRYYAERLSAVEINNSFYRAPAEETLHKWANQVADDFRFVLKMNRRVTHAQRLKPEADEYLAFFLDRVSRLGEKLGPILFQLPPHFTLDLIRLERIFTLLPPRLSFAFEFRHLSWDEPRVHSLLRNARAAWCISDSEGSPIDPQTVVPGDSFVYLRLRQEYTPDKLAGWADAIRSWLSGGLDVYAFFKHEESGSGPQFAVGLQRLIASAPATWQFPIPVGP